MSSQHGSIRNESVCDLNPSKIERHVKRSCTDLPCLLLLCTSCLCWIVLAVLSVYHGNLPTLYSPINSAGETCGDGNQAGKHHLLYLDLAQCAGVHPARGACPTHQVCVQECPETYWTIAQGKASGLEQFCDNVTSMQMEDDTFSLSKVVVEGRCPAYLIPSRSVLGRCVPMIGLDRRGTNNRTENKLKAIKKETGKSLDIEELLRGVEYVFLVTNSLDVAKKLLQYFPLVWRELLIILVLTIVMSLAWTLIISLRVRILLLISIILSIIIILAISVFCIIKYSIHQASSSDLVLPPVIRSITAYHIYRTGWLVVGIVLGIIIIGVILGLVLYCKKINLAVLLIQEAREYMTSLKFLILIPVIISTIILLLLFTSVTIASYLATVGTAEFRVVDSCSSETCINIDTGDMFENDDVCDPNIFAGCTGCPRAQCLFHRLAPSLLSYGQAFNVLMVFWIISCIRSCCFMTYTGVVARVYWERANDGFFIVLKKIFGYHLGTVACVSFIPFLGFTTMFPCSLGGGVLVSCVVYGDNCIQGRKRYKTLLEGNAGKLQGLSSVYLLIYLVIALGIVSLASAVFVSYSTQLFGSAELQLTFTFFPFLVFIIGSYAIVSTFISIYYVAVNTMLFRFLEELITFDGEEHNEFFNTQQLLEILHKLGDQDRQPINTRKSRIINGSSNKQLETNITTKINNHKGFSLFYILIFSE